MPEQHEELLEGFVRRFAAIERQVPDPPTWSAARASVRPRLRLTSAPGLTSLAALVVVAVLLGAALLTRASGPVATRGPSPSASASAPVPPSPSVGVHPMTWEFGSMSLVTPPGWQLVAPHVWTAPVGPRAFLSNAPIVDPCPSTLVSWVACQKPLAFLPPGGILVTMEGVAEAIPSNKAPVVTTHQPGPVCAALEGDVELSAIFPGFGLDGCVRGPDLAAGEATFRGIVASVERH